MWKQLTSEIKEFNGEIVAKQDLYDLDTLIPINQTLQAVYNMMQRIMIQEAFNG